MIFSDNADTNRKPTNHLDMEGLDALMDALKVWNGGSIVISHDERFITTVAREVGCYVTFSMYVLTSPKTALGLCEWK